jgi:8-oxo-dGTP pyrophosphatase MutT (NUDIX family)
MNGTLEFKIHKTSVCSNCGISGHHYKNCIEPITSYGIIAFRINDPNWNQAEKIAMDELNGIPDEKNIEYLLIQRRDSIGFIELLRAKYRLTDLYYITEQICGITKYEREILLSKSFDELWVLLWGPLNSFENKQHKQEYEQAKVKFEMLKQGIEINGQIITLESLIKSAPLLYDTPEWGFPKGRRNVFETDYKCAIREFCEETGLNNNDIRIFENIDPIRETFFGSNNIHYCHVYYLAWIPNRVQIKVNPQNNLMNREIGNIKWFTRDQAITTIRPTNVEKREVLLRASSLLRNLCPIFVGPVVSVAEHEPQMEGDVSNRNRGNGHTTNINPTNPWYRRNTTTKYNFIEEEIN